MRNLIFSLMLAASAVASAPAFAQSADSSAMPTCASGDPVVWANTHTKKYHLQGDAYYGKTKHGKYLCKSAADAQNYKLAGAHGPNAAPSPMASGTMSYKHHHRHHHMPASPSPSMAPDPSAS